MSLRMGWTNRFITRLLMAFALCLWLSNHSLTAQSSTPVDLVLVLAVDCSYSVDEREFRLQVEGMGLAFRHPEIIAAIKDGAYGRIAVTVVQWSDDQHQTVAVPWTLVDDSNSAAALAGRLVALPRMLAEGGTSISAAMTFSMNQLLRAPFAGTRRVIDIASDGRNNNGADPRVVRDQIAATGVTINGLSILNEVPTLDKYFLLYVTGGPANFVEIANDYGAYRQAIKRKLLREITGPKLS